MRACFLLVALAACSYDVDSVAEPCSFDQHCTTSEAPYCGDDLRCTTAPSCTPMIGTLQESGADALGFATSINVPGGGQSMLIISISDSGSKVASVIDNVNVWGQVAAPTPDLAQAVEIWAAHYTRASTAINVNYDRSGKHSVVGMPISCLVAGQAIVTGHSSSSGMTTITAGSVTTDRVSLVLAVVNTQSSMATLTTQGFGAFDTHYTGAIGHLAYAVVPPGTYEPTWTIAGGVITAGIVVALDTL